MAVTRHVMIDADVYEVFASYARSRGFTVKKAFELAVSHAANHDLASEWLKEFLVNSLPSRKTHSLENDVLRQDIKELTQTREAPL